jgi:hypothetical protein
MESKILCVSRNVTLDESLFLSLLSESTDESTFNFNPFDVASDLDNNLDEPLFCPFPEQEVLVLGNFPIDEI